MPCESTDSPRRSHVGAVAAEWPRLAPMALETSPTVAGAGPGDRQHDRRLDRPARLGLGRGPGRPDQPPPGRRHRLPHPARPVADISVPVTCTAHAARRRCNPPLRRGRAAWWCTPSRTSTPTGARCRSARRRDPPGRPRRAAGPARAAQEAARRRGAVRPEPQAAAAVPARPGRPDHRPGSAAERDVLDNARRRWPAVELRRSRTPRCRAQRAATEIIDALDRLDRDPTVDVIVIARGGGSVEDLLPFSDEALCRAVRLPHPGRLRDRPRDRHPAARLRRRRPRLHADRRGQAGRPRPRRGAAPRRVGPRPAPRHHDRLARPGAGRARRAALAPGAGRPPQPARRPASDEVAAAARPGPPHPRPPARPRRATTSATSAPGPGRSPRRRPWSAATPCCRTPTATSSPRSPTSPRRRRRQRPRRRRPRPRHHDRRRARPAGRLAETTEEPDA